MASRKKTGFLRKQPLKVAGGKFVHSLVRNVSGVGTAYGLQKLAQTNLNFDRRVLGPAAWLLGFAAEVFIDNEYVETAGQGVQVIGSLRATGDTFLPKSKTDFGLAGIGAVSSEEVVIEVNGEATNWKRLAEEASSGGGGGQVSEGMPNEMLEMLREGEMV